MSLLLGLQFTDQLPQEVLDELDQLVSAIQAWAGKVDGLNTAERLNQLTSGVSSLQGVPTGAGFVWYTNTAPVGYVLCDGSPIGRTTNAKLFALLGTQWGAGDGSTTFNVPDLRQRVPLGKAASGTGSTLAGTGGAIDHTHTGPSHTHSFSGTSGAPSALFAAAAGGINSTGSVGHTHDTSGTTGAEGTGATGTNNPPYLVVNYIIKT